MGGPGSEREVSLASGAGVAKALRSLGAEVTEVDVENADFVLPAGTELAFIAMHGTFGEDGQVQQILEERGIPYTGEGVAGSELAIDKIATKESFPQHGVPTPDWEMIRHGAAADTSVALSWSRRRAKDPASASTSCKEREEVARRAEARPRNTTTNCWSKNSSPAAN